MNATKLLETLHLADLVLPARANEALTRADLERVLRAANPLAAAALADIRREATSGVAVTYPVTLRVRAPGLEVREDAAKVSLAVEDAAGVDATDMEMVGALPAEPTLGQAAELVRIVAAARPELPLRAFAADDVAAIASRERLPFEEILEVLARAGLATLGWRAGADLSTEALRVHRFALEAGLKTFAPVAYGHGGLGKPFLDRLETLRDLAASTRGFVSAVLVPERTEGASPLSGTAGTEDIVACALARLALGPVVPHVTVDAHVLGSKLGGVLLSCGADDFVGAQAARAWAPPTDDGPRPLNEARATKLLLEARRSPVRRDGLFRATSGGAQTSAR